MRKAERDFPKAVDRRIGGLETACMFCKSNLPVDRRIGGLEI